MISLKKGVAYTFTTRLILFGLGMAVSILLARFLGPADRGKYAILLLVPTILLKLGTAGTEVANVYFTASKKYQLQEIVSNSVLVSLLFGMVMIGGFSVVYALPIFTRYMAANGIQGSLVWVLVALVPVMISKLLMNRVLLGKGKILSYNITETLQVGLQLLSIVIMVVALQWGLRGAVIGYVVATAIDVVVIFLFINSVEPIRLRFNREVLRESLRYGTKAYLGNIAQFLNYRLDTLIVSILLGVREVGYYAIAVGMAERLWMIPGSISTVLLPKVSASEESRATFYTLFSTKLTFYVVSMIAVILGLMSRWVIVFLFGDAYLPAVTPLILLLPGIVALSVGKVLTSDLAGRGRPEFGAVSSAVSLVLTVAMDLILIPKLGIVGAAVASSGSYILGTLIVVVSFIRVTGSKPAQLFVLSKEDLLRIIDTIKPVISRRKEVKRRKQG